MFIWDTVQLIYILLMIFDINNLIEPATESHAGTVYIVDIIFISTVPLHATKLSIFF